LSSCNFYFHKFIFRSRTLRALLLSHPEALIFSTPPPWLFPSLFFLYARSPTRALNEIIPVAFPIGWDLYPHCTDAPSRSFFSARLVERDRGRSGSPIGTTRRVHSSSTLATLYKPRFFFTLILASHHSSATDFRVCGSWKWINNTGWLATHINFYRSYISFFSCRRKKHYGPWKGKSNVVILYYNKIAWFQLRDNDFPCKTKISFGLLRCLYSSHRSSESSESSYESDANAEKRNQEFLASSLSGDKAFSRKERSRELEARGKEPVNISPRGFRELRRWSNEQPKYRTEGCLLASLAASSRLKKPRKDGGKKRKEGTTERAGEKNCAARKRPSDFIASREKERSTQCRLSAALRLRFSNCSTLKIVKKKKNRRI